MPWFLGGRTLVQNLITEFEELEANLQQAIDTLDEERNNLQIECASVHSHLTEYDTAKGNVVELFYNTVEENESRSNIIHADGGDIISDLREKKREISRKLGQLAIHRQTEISEDRELTESEIILY